MPTKRAQRKKPIERRKNMFAVELAKGGFKDIFPVIREGKLLEKGTRKVQTKQISDMRPALWAPEHSQGRKIVYIETNRRKKVKKTKPSMPGIRRLRKRYQQAQSK